MSGSSSPDPVRPPLPEADYRRVYAQVPRLTVELVVRDGEGVRLVQRRRGPCRGLWVLPGGTVRFGETLREAVQRVGRQELGLVVRAGRILGTLEYPSHLANVGDWPVGIAYEVSATGPLRGRHGVLPDPVRSFTTLPEAMHDEQRAFLEGLGPVRPQRDQSAARLRPSV